MVRKAMAPMTAGRRRWRGAARGPVLGLVTLAMTLALILAGCGGPPPPPPAPPRIELTGEQCIAALVDRGAAFDRRDDFREGNGCGVADAVSMWHGTAAFSRPATMSCQLALALMEFETQIAQPAALRHFGVPILRTHHVGTYACRRRTGGGRLSEHAHGRAIDIIAFELADGRMVRVEQDWRGSGDASRFLQDVGRGACGVFSVVLTPNHDRAHRDHFHFDIGPWRLCGM